MNKRSKHFIARTPEAIARVLDLPVSAAREWRVQLQLLGELKRIIARNELTHAEIAKRAKTSRTRVTAILNGNIQSVTSDLLIRILSSLGYAVNVSVVRERKAA